MWIMYHRRGWEPYWISPFDHDYITRITYLSLGRTAAYTFPNNHTEFESFIFLYVWLHSLHARSRSLRLVTVILETSPENLIAIIHISIWNVSFSILIGQNSVAEWLSG